MLFAGSGMELYLMGDRRRVVITGMGVVSALGLDIQTLWRNMLDGKNGIKPITTFDVSQYKTPYGGTVDDEQLTSALAEIGIKPVDRTLDMAYVAAHQALLQSGLIKEGAEREHQDVATVFGTGVGSTYSIYASAACYFEKGMKAVRPTTVPRCMANVISSQISIRYKLIGANYVMVSACASSTLAIGNAFRMVRDGYIDKVLCGGSDAIFNPGYYCSWNNLGVMSKNPDPEKACRPFDRDRDGCVLGEGAGALVVESMESAIGRGATVLAEIIGYGESSDSTHITTPSVEGQARAIVMAMKMAKIGAGEIGFVNAHGTATRANDSCEAGSMRLALGDAVDSIPVSSNKSFFGHMLGASGAVEMVVTVLGLQAGRVPPSRNLDNPDPACDLNFVGPESIAVSSPVAMKNSFGFGGNNGVIILRKG